MMRSPQFNLARFVPACCCLLLAACSGMADDSQNGSATGGSRRVAGYAAPLEWRAALLAAADTSQPTAANAGFSTRPAHCVQALGGGGMSLFVVGGNFGNGEAGFAFGPLALLTGGLTASPASTTSTSFFFGMRLDPRAAYAAPLDYACGF